MQAASGVADSGDPEQDVTELLVGIGEVAQVTGARIESAVVSRYLATLAELRIVRRKLPVGAAASSRGAERSRGTGV